MDTAATGTTPAPITHKETGLTAPVEYWRALSAVTTLRVQKHTRLRRPAGDLVPAGRAAADTADEQYELYDTAVTGHETLTGLLLLGIHHACTVGSPDGRYAIIWILDELQRRAEERQRNDVIRQETEAVKALAAALTAGGEQAFLVGLLSRLTDPTRHAVLQQLGG
jgi:hypothetical protein